MVLGGPLYQLFLRMRIVRQPLDLLGRRVVVISMLAWLPLLVLSLVIGRAWGGAKVPFLYDIAAHARFLISLPLLIIAEWVVHARVRPLIGQFLERRIVAPQDVPKFDQIIESSQRLRNSVVAEVALLIAVFTGGQFLFRTQATVHATSWYADQTPGGINFTTAGLCYVYWSLPLYQFILFRWYFRLLIWCRFLWKVSRLNLQLIPTHPDHAGGLGFLAGTAHALMPLLVAQSVTVAGVFASRIFFTGAELVQFKIEILILMLFLLALALGPLIVFAPGLAACQRRGNVQYGLLASRYVADFENKWVKGGEANRQELLGSADVQSLADMGNSFEVIRSMSPFPFTKATAVRLAVISALPLLPLLLTVIPFDELVDRLFRSIL
jgi:hypothetical protein